MFKSEFQGGRYVEIFNAKLKQQDGWKFSSSGITRVFDKEVKSYILSLEGSTATTKIQLPKDPKNSLSLLKRFFLIQVNIPKGHDFSVDLVISDMGNNRRHLILSTTYKETKTDPLHSQMPLGVVRRAMWLSLCLDLLSLVGENWKGQTYKAVESICISGTCRLRRIFAMKGQPLDTTQDDELLGYEGTNSNVELDDIPRQCQLASDLTQETQVINMTKLRYWEGKGKPMDAVCRANSANDFDLNASLSKKGGPQEPYHIAFGTKVAGSAQPPRKGSGKEGSTTSRQTKSYNSRSRSDPVSAETITRVPHPPSTERRAESAPKEKHVSRRERKNSDPGANIDDPDITVDKDSLRTSHTWTDGADNKESIPFVKPHPPTGPSKDRVRRKPRVRSATKDLSSAHSSAPSSQNGSTNSITQVGLASNQDDLDRVLPQGHSSANRGRVDTNPVNDNGLQYNADDSISDVVALLQQQDIAPDDGIDMQHDAQDSDEDEEINKEGTLYMFSSPPKQLSSQRKNKDRCRNVLPPKRKTRAETHNRNRKKDLGDANHESDFVSQCSSEDDVSVRTRVLQKTSSPRPNHPATGGYHASRYSDRGSTSTDRHSLEQRQRQDYTSQNGLLQIPGGGEPTIPVSSRQPLSVSKKDLREIPKNSLQSSGNDKPYNFEKYQVAELTDSMEADMLLGFKNQLMGEDNVSSEEDNIGKPLKSPSHFRYSVDDDSSDDTSNSTLRITGYVADAKEHNYHDEMKAESAEFLSQSNPRDWGNVFSPPIVLASALKKGTERDFPGNQNNALPQTNSKAAGPQVLSTGDVRRDRETDGEEELDLLYDPVLNCYYDPKTCKYYELRCH